LRIVRHQDKRHRAAHVFIWCLSAPCGIARFCIVVNIFSAAAHRLRISTRRGRGVMAGSAKQASSGSVAEGHICSHGNILDRWAASRRGVALRGGTGSLRNVFKTNVYRFASVMTSA